MKIKTIYTLTLALALSAAPSFAAKTYNASHSNTANTAVADKDAKNNSKPAPAASKTVADGAAKGQANEKADKPPADVQSGAMAGKRRY